MGRKRNTFSKAIKQLKSTRIDEKLQVLNEIPTNSTSGLYSLVPGALTRVEIDKENPTIPDYSTIDWDVDGSDGQDTSGLFDSSGESRFIAPPGDNSYILGPMSAMFYNYWAGNHWTMIGYIRESDRRMVNLGYVQMNSGTGFNGELDEWDGVNHFTSYGQLTLEQARWFRDTAKKDGAGTSSGSHNYRAFYPGPPSSTPDAFGRYLCAIVGTPKVQKDNAFTRSPIDLNVDSNFSAIMDTLKGLRKKGLEIGSDIGDGIEDGIEVLKDIGDKTTRQTLDKFAQLMATTGGVVTGLAVALASDLKGPIKKAIMGGESETWARGGDHPIMNNSPNELAYTMNLALSLSKSQATGNMVMIDNRNVDPSIVGNKISKADIDLMFKTNNVNSKEDLQNGRPTVSTSADQVLNPGSAKQPYMKGLVAPGFGSEGGSIMQPYIAKDGTIKILNTADKTLRIGGESGEEFDIKTQTFTDIPAIPNVSDLVKKAENQLIKGLQASSAEQGVSPEEIKDATKNVLNDPKYKAVLAALDSPAGNYLAGKSKGFTNSAAAGSVLYSKVKQVLGFQKTTELEKKGGHGHVRRENVIGLEHLKPEVKAHLLKKMGITNVKESYISEERKLSILKNLKKPVVIPETKQKSYKVSPGKRLNQKTNFQGMDKLIGDTKLQKTFKKPQDIWSQDWQGYNAKLSQNKKNEVLELIGNGKQSFDYMLTDSRAKNAEEMEKFWGLHPELYSYNFNGKKYKATRKEQIKGDYIVFLVDEVGEKSSILQSVLNEKLAEEDEKRMLDEYNKLNPKNEPIPYEKDPLFKKVAKRLKNEIDYPDKPARKGYPNEPPPKQVDGWHPDYGKRYKYDKLDPVSAVAMRNAPTGNPEIDANVEKAARKPKI